MTHLGEGSNLGLAIIRWDVVNGDTLLTRETQVDHLRHALVGSIPGLEVKIRSPVVAARSLILSRHL